MSILPATRLTRAAGWIRWTSMLQGLLVTLVVTVPTLVVAEDWHGHPMIDQPGHLWVVPTLVVAAGFVLGGAICARRTVELWRALLRGLVMGTGVVGTLLVADVARRSMHGQTLSQGVLRLWIEAAVLSVVLSSLGGAAGYLHATRRP